MSLPRCRAVSAIAAALMLGWSAQSVAGPSIGQFEVKNLESTPGEIEFQSQNAHMFGQPGRRVAEGDDETLYDDNSIARQRHALELEFGITPRLKSRVGIEYEKERVDDPVDPSRRNDFDGLRLSEVGAEVIFVIDPIEEDDDWGLGVVAEYERPTGGREASSLLLGTIVQARQGPWWGNVNLYLVRPLGGDRPRDGKLDFAYASQFGAEIDDHWRVALEAYGTVDRLGNTGRRDEAAERFGDHDQHRAGPLLYYATEVGGDEDGVEVLLGAGVLAGLNRNTPAVTLKWTVEVAF